MKKNILLLFVGITIAFSGCRSKGTIERIEDLQKQITALNNSGQYWADMSVDELYDLREELIILLLKEGGREVEIYEGWSGTADRKAIAKERAQYYFETVLKIGNKEYAIQNLDVKKTWTALSWAWDGFSKSIDTGKGAWTAWKTFFPPLWAYTIPESVVCFLVDIFGGYKKVMEKKIVLPKINALHILRAKRGLKALGISVPQPQPKTQAPSPAPKSLDAQKRKFATELHWTHRIAHAKAGKGGKLDHILLHMFDDAAQERDGLTFRMLVNDGPFLFFGKTPSSKEKFQSFVLDTLKKETLDSLKKRFQFDSTANDLSVAHIFNIAFYLYGADVAYIKKLLPILKGAEKWAWKDEKAKGLISSTIRSIEGYITVKEARKQSK